MNKPSEPSAHLNRCHPKGLARISGHAAKALTIVAMLLTATAVWAQQGPELIVSAQPTATASSKSPETAPQSEIVASSAEVDSVRCDAPRECRPSGCGICFPDDQLWLINTRRLPRCCALPEDPAVSRYEPHRGWRPASFDEFLATDDPTVPTSIWVHGNRTSYGESRAIGRQFFDRLRPHAAGGRPLRLVIWSWPADQIRGRPLLDFRVKAARSDVDAFHLAAVIGRINPRAPIGMVGYSYGVRIITGALHVLGGGRIRGQGLDESVVALPRPLQAALLAGAVNNYWIVPSGTHGLAVSQVDRMLVTKNPSDKVLKYYPITEYGRIRSGPQALGYHGVAGKGRLGPDAHKVRHLCVTPWVGRDHDLESYIAQRGIMSRVAPYAFFDGWHTELAAAKRDDAHE